MRWRRWDRLLKEREQAWNRPQNASCLQKPQRAAEPPVRLKLTTAKILVVATRASFYLPVCLWHTVLKRCDIFLIWFSLLLSPPWLTRLSLLSSAPRCHRAALQYTVSHFGAGVCGKWSSDIHKRVQYWRQFVGQMIWSYGDRRFGNVLGFSGRIWVKKKKSVVNFTWRDFNVLFKKSLVKVKLKD